MERDFDVPQALQNQGCFRSLYFRSKGLIENEYQWQTRGEETLRPASVFLFMRGDLSPVLPQGKIFNHVLSGHAPDKTFRSAHKCASATGASALQGAAGGI